jgi:alcohol dehydrogenase
MFLPDNYEFACPVKTNAGNRALEHLPVELDALNARKPLVITGKAASQKGLVDILTGAFADSGITLGVFDGVPDGPDIRLIRDLFKTYRDGGCDAVIALGGGPAADTAKILNIAVSGEPEDLEKCAGENLIQKVLKPFVYIPTLTGTGFETSRFAFIGNKMYASHFLMPDLVLIDPRITVSESVRQTAAAALVALTQGAEAYVSPAKNPLTDCYAYAAVQFIMENLVGVVRNPQDRNGCMALANAHCMAGCAFSNAPAGMAHRLGRAAGDAGGISHGLCMGILLPHVLERSLSLAGYHLADLLLPLAGMSVFAATAEEKRAGKAVDAVYGLQEDLFRVGGGAVPRTLEEAKVPREALREIARQEADDGSKGFDADTCLAVLEQAWKGK